MAMGTCTGWHEDRGFGFIRRDSGGGDSRGGDSGGGDIFVHRRNITGALWLTQGQRVEFDVGEDPRTGRPQAQNVKLV